MRQYGKGILLGVLSVTPVIGLISLGYELIGHVHLPVERLHATFGLAITDMVLFAEQAFVIVPYFVWGLLVSTIALSDMFFLLKSRRGPCPRQIGDEI